MWCAVYVHFRVFDIHFVPMFAVIIECVDDAVCDVAVKSQFALVFSLLNRALVYLFAFCPFFPHSLSLSASLSLPLSLSLLVCVFLIHRSFVFISSRPET